MTFAASSGLVAIVALWLRPNKRHWYRCFLWQHNQSKKKIALRSVQHLVLAPENPKANVMPQSTSIAPSHCPPTCKQLSNPCSTLHVTVGAGSNCMTFFMTLC